MSVEVWDPCGHLRTPENTVTVRGRFHYCRICNRVSANRRFRAKHPKAKPRAFLTLDEAIAARIVKTPSHWVWQGTMREDMQAVCVFDGETIFVASTLWEDAYGPIPPRHCVYRTCVMSA